jgi:NADH:ubiquinone oxidoreductase subunit C
VTAFDQLPDAAAELFGEGATAVEAYDLLTVDVPVGSWVAALTTARDVLGCTFFDWLSAVDEPGTGFRVCAHVARLGDGVRRLLVRTTVPYEAADVPTATGVYPGAAWHERETHEMFGVGFPGHPGLAPLLLPEEFEGHPLRKDFVLAARVAKAWPGAKEPGESHEGGPKRRQMLPPGVPDPNEWGPLRGQLPPAPARPGRTPRAAGAAPGDRPVRRARSAAEGSASQAAASGEVPARRARSAAEGSVSQAAASGDAAGAPAAPRRRVPDAPWEQPAREPGTPPAPAPAAPPAAQGPADGDAEPSAGAATSGERETSAGREASRERETESAATGTSAGPGPAAEPSGERAASEGAATGTSGEPQPAAEPSGERAASGASEAEDASAEPEPEPSGEPPRSGGSGPADAGPAAPAEPHRGDRPRDEPPGGGPR